MLSQFKNKEALVYLGICLLLFVYMVLRAIYVPIVHDEAVTFFNYINTGRFIPLYNWQSHADANNHVLNSAISTLFYNWFGPGWGVYRIGSVLSMGFLFIYLWKIAQWLKNQRIRWVFILSILGSHYFMEFFSLTRGYGMSMAMLVPAIYYLFSYLRTPSNKYLVWYAVFMILGLLANLTLVNTALIGFCLIVLKWVIDPVKPKIWTYLITLIGVLLPTIGFILLGMKYKEMNLLYYGQGDSYWEITVNTFFERFTLIENLNLWVYPIIMPILLISLVLFVKRTLELKWEAIHNYHVLFAALFFGNLAASIIQTSFMDVNYPEDRTALFFFPFMIGTLCFQASYQTWTKYLCLPLLYLPINFILTMNLTHNSFWRSERFTEEFYMEVYKDYESTGEQPTVGGHNLRQVVWDYYNHQNGGELGRVHIHDYEQDTVSDYILGYLHDEALWEKQYDRIMHDEYSDLCLFKRRTKLTPKVVQDWGTPQWLDNTTQEFVNFNRYFADDMAGNRYQIQFDLLYRPKTPPNDANLVVQGIDANGKETCRDYFSLERFRTNFDHKIECFQKLNTPIIPEGTVELRVYLWNVNEEEFLVHNGRARVLKY